MPQDRKTVLLLRHGKSDWGAEFGSDHQRPLAPRGVEAARSVGLWLTANGYQPDLILSSDATRARTTTELAAQAGGWTCPVELRPEFYGANAATLIGALRELAPEVGTVLLTGHQPTWSETASRLAGGGRLRFPTAALAGLDYYGSWSEMAPGRCELRWLLPPKMILGA